MQLFGFTEPGHITVDNFELQESVKLGEKVAFSFSLSSDQTRLGKIRIEYAVDFMKHNGKQARKVFKISESDISSQNKPVTKTHSFKEISTRKHYLGAHGLAIIINGHELHKKAFMLEA